MACATELDAVVSCVERDSNCKKCFEVDDIENSWPLTAENLFRSNLAFKSPADPEFCYESNWRICRKAFYPGKGERSCCCLEETHAYMACGYQEGGWLERYMIADHQCKYRGCEIFDVNPDGPSRASIGGLAGGYAVLFVGLCYHWYWKRPGTKCESVDWKEKNQIKNEKQ